METSEGKRTRKPVSYAILDNSDDDFSEATPPVKKKKDDKTKYSETSNSSQDSLKSSSSQIKDREKNEKLERKENDRKSRHSEKDEKREKDKKRREKDKDREKDRDRNSNKHHKKDKHRDRDRERSRDRDKHRSDKEKDRDRKDKYDKKDEKKVSKNRIPDDEDNDFQDRIRSPRASKCPLTSTQKSPIKSPGRGAPKPRLTVEERKFKRELEKALAISKIEEVEPSKEQKSLEKNDETNCESKIIPNEDENSKDTISELDKTDSKTSPIKETNIELASDPSQIQMKTSESLHEGKDVVCSPIPKLVLKIRTSNLNDVDKKESLIEVIGSESNATEVIGSESNATEVIGSEVNESNTTKVIESKATVINEINTIKVNEKQKLSAAKEVIVDPNDDPQPSTSTGRTSKRQRKTVAFLEDSDSDSFVGFDASDLSEESDFAPSPVKKKSKPTKKETKKAKSPTSNKTGTVKKSIDKGPKQPAARSRTSSGSISAKENTAPRNVSSSSPSVQSPVVLKPSPSVSNVKTPSPGVSKPSPSVSNVHRPSPSSAASSKLCEKPKVTNTRTNSSNSSDSASPRIGLVKGAFRSPVLQGSNSSTPNYVPNSPNPIRKIGVRLGLSRSGIKPLHPGAISK